MERFYSSIRKMLIRMKERFAALLHWSERYTKTDMIYLTRGGFWSVLGQGCAAFISFGLAIVMAHFVPKDIYGDYKYILATIAIISTFSLSGINTAVFQSIASGYRDALQEGFWENIRWSFIIFLGAFAIGAYYLFRGNEVFGIGILIGGCFTPFFSSFNLYVSLFSAKKDFKRLAWYGDIVTNFIPAIALVIVAYLAPQPIFLLLAYFIGNTTAAAYAYWRGVKHYPDTEKKYDPGMFAYGKHISVMNILGGIASNIDQILLFHFVGPIQLAIYNFATAIPDQLKGPTKTLDSMLQARFATRSETEINSGISNKILWLFISSIIFVGIYIPLAPVIFHFFFSKYIDAIFYSQLYSLSWLALILSPSASFLSIKKKVKELYISNIVGNLFQIIAIVIGVLYWGLIGIIGARIAGRLFGSVLNYTLYRISLSDQ